MIPFLRTAHLPVQNTLLLVLLLVYIILQILYEVIQPKNKLFDRQALAIPFSGVTDSVCTTSPYIIISLFFVNEGISG